MREAPWIIRLCSRLTTPFTVDFGFIKLVFHGCIRFCCRLLFYKRAALHVYARAEFAYVSLIRVCSVSDSALRSACVNIKSSCPGEESAPFYETVKFNAVSAPCDAGLQL